MDKKVQKKKDRAKRVRKQVLLQRAALRAPKQEENKLRRKMKRITKLKKDMGKLNVWADDVLLGLSDKALTQLERNAKILKALEEEYQTEADRKKDLNDKLEAEGCLTLDEKLNHLHAKLAEEQKRLYAEGKFDLKESGEELKDGVDNTAAVGHTDPVTQTLRDEVTGVQVLNDAVRVLTESYDAVKES